MGNKGETGLIITPRAARRVAIKSRKRFSFSSSFQTGRAEKIAEERREIHS